MRRLPAASIMPSIIDNDGLLLVDGLIAKSGETRGTFEVDSQVGFEVGFRLPYKAQNTDGNIEANPDDLC